MTDDGEVQLNLPREEDMERNLPGKDVRDLPGETASGASVTNQEERYRLDTRSGRPLRLLRSPVFRGQKLQ